MKLAGAPAQAVEFSRSLPEMGYLQAFVPTGQVSIAFVMYPLRANQNDACLLVNGTPDHIDIDNLRALPLKSLEADPGYVALAAKNPKIALWPGDRSDRRSVTAGTTPNGQRFLVDYFLLDGCHACARLGRARFAFDFDADGKFQSAQFVSIRPMGE
jgi:hypothetical protein